MNEWYFEKVVFYQIKRVFKLCIWLYLFSIEKLQGNLSER